MIRKNLKKVIYLDHHATTPVDPGVFRAMRPYFEERFGNAASFTHRFGNEAHLAVERSRGEVARLIGARAREIIFTSGATESNNLAIKGAAEAARGKGGHLVTVETEHKSVLDPSKRLGFEGFRVTYLRVGRDGLLNLGDLKRALTSKTILISVMLANNETGVIQPVAEIGQIARKAGVLFHCDAAQAVGKIPVNVERMGADLLSFTAHKLYGPKGVGALYVRKTEPRVRLRPLLDGGGHEGGFRSGTLNVPGIVGFGEACRISRQVMPAESKRTRALRDRLKKGLLKEIPDAVVNGSLKNRLPNNLNLSFPGIKAKDLIARLDTVAISAGSACTSTSPEPSYVLKAMGVPEELRRASIRVGLGRFTTARDIDHAVRKIVKVTLSLRRRFLRG